MEIAEIDRIASQLLQACQDCIAASAELEPKSLELSKAKAELEQIENDCWVELIVLGSAGPLNAKNADDRKSQFRTWLFKLADSEPYKVALSHVQNLEREVMNARMHVSAQKTKLDALKTVMEIRTSQLVYEAQVIAGKNLVSK